MRPNMVRHLMILSISIVLVISAVGNCSSEKERRQSLLSARTVQIDMGFEYYKGRSDESIASELELNGIKGVYIIVLDENAISPGLIKAFQNRGMPVAAMFFAPSVYTPSSVFPEGWQEWKMEFTTDELKAYTFLSYVHEDYCEWLKKRVVRILEKFNFDGFTFAEAMYPIYDGPTRQKVLYGDVSKGFQEHFRQATGNKDFPDFTNAEHPNYFRKNIKLYNDLVKYRIKTINDFYGNVVNGKGGIREVCPDVVVASWSMAVNIPDGIEKMAQWEGDDLASMIRIVKPDIHFLQTHAPDWINPFLSCDYVKFYRPYLAEIRATDKNVKIGLQADIGSLATMRKNPSWMNGFYKACADEKIDTTTCYEFNLRWQIYACAPSLKKAEVQKDGSVKLYFDKRISNENAKLFRGRTIENSMGNKYSVINVKVDGNILEMELDKLPATGTKITVPLEGICDDPAVRLAGSSNVLPLPLGPVNKIPAGTKQLIQLD